jgi:hypothetical protein
LLHDSPPRLRLQSKALARTSSMATGDRFWYIVTVVPVERVQTGLRIERNTLKVLKGVAEYLDLSLGDLVEGIVLHAFEGQAPFTPPVLAKIDQLRAVYDLTLTAADAHKLTEEE